jgi:hypothetical protein
MRPAAQISSQSAVCHSEMILSNLTPYNFTLQSSSLTHVIITSKRSYFVYYFVTYCTCDKLQYHFKVICTRTCMYAVDWEGQASGNCKGKIPAVTTLSVSLVFPSAIRKRKHVHKTIFGPKRDEVTGGWRKLHNEELHGLYSSPSTVRWSKWGGWDGRGMWRAWGRWGVHTTFWLGDLKGGDH